jgi:hypothetical protein
MSDEEPMVDLHEVEDYHDLIEVVSRFDRSRCNRRRTC